MWFFRSPRVVFGAEALDYLAEIGGTRALIVTDPALVELGFVELLTERLDAAGVEHHLFAEVTAEPTLDLVRRGAGVAQQVWPDLIIGLGGGSAMDTAKAIRVLYERPDISVDGISPLEPLNLTPNVKLITVPTTSGTGAEVSWAVVLTDKSSHRKLVLGSPEGLPDYAIVDPVFTINLPIPITRDTGMDALAHAIEGFISTWRNDFSDGLMVKAAELIFEYLPRVCASPWDAEARERMHNAATIAGFGLGNSQAGICHSMAHALGGSFPVPHGRLIGMCLPYALEFIANGEPEHLALLARYLGLTDSGGKQGALDLVYGLHNLMVQIGHPDSLQQVGVTEEQFVDKLHVVLENAMEDPSVFTSPRMPNADEMTELLWCVYRGAPVTF